MPMIMPIIMIINIMNIEMCYSYNMFMILLYNAYYYAYYYAYNYKY